MTGIPSRKACIRWQRIRQAFKDLDLTIAGKTGTAQQSKSHPNHALFMGYAPYENPQIAIAIRIANGYTSANAAAMASDIFSYYFDLKVKMNC